MRQKRISDYGYRIGHHENGPRNKITDVPGVRVGHATVESGNQHTGVTVIVPGRRQSVSEKVLGVCLCAIMVYGKTWRSCAGTGARNS